MRAIILFWFIGVFAAPVGKVIFSLGEAKAENAGDARVLKRGSEVFEGDTLKTLANSRLHVRFVDGAMWDLQSNTTMVIDAYQHDENSVANNASSLKFVEGGFKTITGKIADVNPARYEVKSDIATMGVRGTYWGAILDAQDLFVSVFANALSDTRGVWIQNASSTFTIGPKEAFMNASVSGSRGAIKGSLKPARNFEVTPSAGDGQDAEGDEGQEENVETTKAKIASAVVARAQEAVDNGADASAVRQLVLQFFERVLDITTTDEIKDTLITNDNTESLGLLSNGSAGVIFGTVAVEPGTNPEFLNALTVSNASQLVKRGTASVLSNLQFLETNPSNVTVDGIEYFFGRWSAPGSARFFTDLSNGTDSLALTTPAHWVYGVPTQAANFPTTGSRSYSATFGGTNAPFVFGADNLGGQINNYNVSIAVDITNATVTGTSFHFITSSGQSWQGQFLAPLTINSDRVFFRSDAFTGTLNSTIPADGQFTGFFGGSTGKLVATAFDMKASLALANFRLNGVMGLECQSGTGC